MQKGVYWARDPRGTDMATQTRDSTNGAGTDPRGRLRGAMAKWTEWIGPMGIVGLVSGIVRGASYAQWVTQNDHTLSPYIGNKIHYFLPCRTKCFFMFVVLD